MRIVSSTSVLLFLLAACIGEAPDAAARVQPVTAQDTAPLEIRFLDVGQGDAILIRSGDKVALVDAGSSDNVVQKLRAAGVGHIDLAVASHNHADHIGGMDAVLDSLPVRMYLDNGHPATTRIQARVLQRVESRNITYLQVTTRNIGLGNATLRVLPPPQIATGAEEQNNRSVGLIVEQGTFRALLTGDSETQAINGWLEANMIPEVNVLKAAHHGSRNGVTPAWLARTRPEVVVISLAADNSYGHPHVAALRLYCAGDRRVFRTDWHGDVVVRVEPSGRYQVRATRRAPPPATPASPGRASGRARTAAGIPPDCGVRP
ncbi:MAG: MBL fold metallo-hydrolase [Gemmatimonadota bacterium]|nr:MBL fold metallo-hydrolase [Gemmatimonadota bacterium]